MACDSQPKRQTKGPLVEGREIKVDALVPDEKMNPGSSKHYIMVRRNLQDGKIYHLVPFQRQSVKPLVPCRTNDNRKLRTRNVKIVVTAEQLELLLSGSKKLQIRRGVACVRGSSALRGCRKWLPSLLTIQEV